MTARLHRVLPLGALVLAVAALVSLLITSRPDPAAAQVVDSRFSLRTIARLDFPTGMQFTPSGDRLFVNEREGRIRIIKRGSLLAAPFATVRTTTSGEGGLLGLALHPRFERGEPWLYVFYTRSDGAVDRVERLRASGDTASAREIVFDNMPASLYHHGGSLAFGTDGKLYVSNGEEHNSSRAQDPNTLGGKVYRLEPNGAIPSDNPFPGEPTFAYGLRNPFGMTVDPRSGRIWVTENGPQDHDEVNRIDRGKNYGWPVVKGKAGDPRFVDPVLDYPTIIVPTMMAFGGDALPSEYRGNLFFGTYEQQAIHRVVLTSGRTGATGDRIFIRPGEGVVGMTMGPDGLYFSTPTRVVRASAPAAVSKPAPKPTTPKPVTSPTLATATPSPSLSPAPSSPAPSATPSATPSRTVATPPEERGGSRTPALIGAAVAVFAVLGLLAWKRRAS